MHYYCYYYLCEVCTAMHGRMVWGGNGRRSPDDIVWHCTLHHRAYDIGHCHALSCTEICQNTIPESQTCPSTEQTTRTLAHTHTYTHPHPQTVQKLSVPHHSPTTDNRHPLGKRRQTECKRSKNQKSTVCIQTAYNCIAVCGNVIALNFERSS